MEGRVGRERGDETGLYTHVAKLPTEFIEGRGSGPSGDGKKRRWVDGMSPCLPFFFHPPGMGWRNGAALEHPLPSIPSVSLSFFSCF